MIPIVELLHRIRWDTQFGAAAFSIGYLDRVAGRVVRVPFSDVRLVKGPRRALEAIREDGGVHIVPLHRVREVWRDGVLIWRRTPENPQR
ncbi:MAG: DUF504 domain-containing protein [Acidobacteriota bacterium]